MEKSGASKAQAKAFTDFVKEAAEQGSKFEQAGVKQEVKGEGVGQSKMERAKAELSKIDYGSLSQSQKDVYDVFIGKKSMTTLKVNDMDDIAILEQGGAKAGAKKIMVKHGGVDKTGGLSAEELVNIENVLLKGKVDKNSFEMRKQSLRYAYVLNQDGVKLRVVVDEFNDGKKVFDYYSNRNFTNYETAIIKQQPDPKAVSKRIIPQNSADRLVEKVIKLDDTGEIGNMLRKTIISKDISTKTKLAVINAAKRRLVAITAKNTQNNDKK